MDLSQLQLLLLELFLTLSKFLIFSLYNGPEVLSSTSKLSA